MAWYDDALGFSWPNVLVVVGVVALVPVLLPVIGYVVRPLVKGAAKTGFAVKDLAVGFMEETRERVSDLVAEAKAEHYARPDA